MSENASYDHRNFRVTDEIVPVPAHVEVFPVPVRVLVGATLNCSDVHNRQLHKLSRIGARIISLFRLEPAL